MYIFHPFKLPWSLRPSSSSVKCPEDNVFRAVKVPVRARVCFHPHEIYKDNRQQHHIKWAQTTQDFCVICWFQELKKKKRLKKLTSVTRNAANAPSTSIGNEVEFWCLYLCPLCDQKNFNILCNTRSMYMWSNGGLLCLLRIWKCSRRTNDFKWSFEGKWWIQQTQSRGNRIRWSPTCKVVHCLQLYIRKQHQWGRTISYNDISEKIQGSIKHLI